MRCSGRPIQFAILQSNLFFEARFATAGFEVFPNPEGLHRALHEKLSPNGLRREDTNYERDRPFADVRLVTIEAMADDVKRKAS